MPGKTDMSSLAQLPADYQKGGHLLAVDDDYQTEPASVAVDDLPVATIEAWLMDPEPVEEWVKLRTKNMKVKLRGLVEAERIRIQKGAPKKMNKQTRQLEPDQNWINAELVRSALVEPYIPNQELLHKALSGDIAHLAREIGRISGFDLDRGDALG